MKVTSREYKVIVDSSWFIDPEPGMIGILEDILEDIGRLAHLLGVGLEGEFDAGNPKERSIVFLDTPDVTFRRNGLLLRQRVAQEGGETGYTLKCRTEDRYVASGKDLSEAPGLKAKSKFEEDIGCPFVSRFSRSTTVSLKSGHKLAGKNLPQTLSVAATLFPGLLTLQRDGLPCVPETTLAPVNGRKVLERVFEGPTLRFPDAGPSSMPATIALILWSKSEKGRALTVEISFRYENEDEVFPLEVAIAAKSFFEGLQRLDWARPEASTKTQYMYG